MGADGLGIAWGSTMSATGSKLIKGATGHWEMVIGLEVHAQVTSNSKLFSGASTEFGGEPNSHVSLVDAAMPGMLPVINEFCVAQAVRTVLGLTAQSTLRSVSVRKAGSTELGTRCEIKNMNSSNFIGQAIEYEARRQIEILEDGGAIDQETRLFDPNRGETRSMRSKEEAHDYRYFPDPDLLPLEFSEAYVAALKAELPELPDQKRARFIAGFGLSPYDAGVLVAERESADFYATVLAGRADKVRDGKLAANWVINELFGRLNKEGRDIAASPVSAEPLRTIVALIGEGPIFGKIAKDLFALVLLEGRSPRAHVGLPGLQTV